MPCLLIPCNLSKSYNPICAGSLLSITWCNHPYELIVDASLGDDKKPSELGTILAQINQQGQHCVIAYASQKLQKHECNYTLFLQEMKAAIWGKEHFVTYLRGHKFRLFTTNHQPRKKLGKVHTKMLNRLQEIMNALDFDIVYKKGSEVPVNYLSHNCVNVISWGSTELLPAQIADPLIKVLKSFY